MNVSAQPKLSPFRYPGGKTRLAELIHHWLRFKPNQKLFIEPFAGGASISLYVATQGLARKVRLVEKDEDVAAVWSTILSADHAWLCKMITNFDLNKRNLAELFSSSPSSNRQKAFRTLVRNRVARSGILWHGAGIVKVGERGNGLSSRWYPATLIKRIKHIHSLKYKVEFVHGCGIEAIKDSKNENGIWFFDPPYSVREASAGRRLYRYNEIDHHNLFAEIQRSGARFLMTHEDDYKTRSLVKASNFQSIRLPVLTAHNKQSMELLIGNDLKAFLKTMKENKQAFTNPISKLDFE